MKMDKESIVICDLTHTSSGSYATNFTPYPIASIKSNVLHFSKYKNKLEIDIFKDPEKFIKVFLSKNPKLVGFSNYIWNGELSYELAKEIKLRSPETLVVFGGPNFPTEAFEKKAFFKSRPLIDFYIESEGEIGFVKVLEKLKEYDFNTEALKKAEENIVNCCYLNGDNLIQAKIERIKDVNILPSPYLDGTLDEFFELPLIPMLETTRGCPFSCTFCADGLTFKNKIYSYDMQRVKDEIKYVCDKVEVKNI